MTIAELKVKIIEAITKLVAKFKAKPGNTPSGDAVDFKSLKFVWGNFNGSAATAAPAVIGNLSINNSGMSYSWLAGGCEQLGASNAKDFDHTYACLFVLRNGSWQGGKFDSISSSRVTRDFKNIYGEGYRGWPRDAVATAGEFAFVIVSTNGAKRTNVIKFKR